MFRILLLEDDPALLRQLRTLLTGKYDVKCASSIAEADSILENTRFDIVVMDRLVSDGDAIELIPYIRECSPSTKIICISSLGLAQDRIHGLLEGADDYVAKPIDPQELLLRIQNLIRLNRSPTDDWMKAGVIKLNRRTGETYVGTTIVHLRPREAQILACLLQFKNRVVTRDSIISHVWGTASIPTNTTLDVYVRRLRMLLGDSAAYIQTARGFGYVIRDQGAIHN